MNSRWYQALLGTRVQAIVGLSLFVFMVLFLVMSTETGGTQFTQAKRGLDGIEVVNLRLDAAWNLVLFNLRTDFDQVARLQQQLRVAEKRFAMVAPTGSGGDLLKLLDEKLARIEDFKSEEAVLRNARAIAEQSISELKRDDHSPSDQTTLYSVESAFLTYISQLDPQSAAQLHATIASVDARSDRITRALAWPTLQRQVDGMLRHSQRMGVLMQSLYTLPIQQTILKTGQQLAAGLAAQSRTANHYRIGLFAIGILLLAFSTAKAVQVRRYVRLIQGARAQLEERVQERTRELSVANMTLLSEITERKSVEAQLRIAQKLESIGQLAAGIAHEINTPAQYVNDNIEFLSDAWRDLLVLLDICGRALENDELRSALLHTVDIDFLQQEVPTALSAAVTGLEQINNILSAMRDLAHPGSATLQPSDINRAVRNAVAIARNEWKHIAEVQLDLDETLPAMACDLSALNQVILNLVVNAAQALSDTGHSGLINVSTRRSAGYAEICVADNGPGVPEDIRERIFDPFFTTKDVGEGTGQGLAIAHRIICKQHKGNLWVERGRDGVGARFIVHLPLNLQHQSAAEALPPDVRSLLPDAQIA